RMGSTARDREMLRGKVLEELGWRIHRVWSMDWLNNPEREIDRIMESIKAAASAGPTPAVVRAFNSQPATEPSREENGSGTIERSDPVHRLRDNWRTAYTTAKVQAVSLHSEAFFD